MLNSNDTLTIVERMINKIVSRDSLSYIVKKSVSDEELLLLNNLLDNFTSKSDTKVTLVLKLVLAYLDLLKNERILSKENYLEFKNILKSIRFNEIELFLPCRNVEWILLEIGKNLISSNDNNKEKNLLLDDLLETTTELFKIVNNDFGLAITNYLSAFRYFKEGNYEKASRLLEMVAHIFKDPLLIWETQYYAALLNYPTNIRRSINLLENCLLLGEKYLLVIKNSNITIEHVEETLNILRREFIIRNHENEDKSFLFKVIDNVIHYYYDKNDLLSLSACYYEAGIIFDKLGYEDTAEEYFVESAVITSDHQQWKLYSKALINLVVKFFEKGRVREAEDYLNDLIQVASYLKDEGLHKKVETLLLSLKKLKEIKPTPITNNSRIEEYISEIDANNTPITTPNQQEISQSYQYETNLQPTEEINLIQSLEVLSNYTPESTTEPVNMVTTAQPAEFIPVPHPENIQAPAIDQSFLKEFKEPINQNEQKEVVISTNDLVPSTTEKKSSKKEDTSSFYAVRKRIASHLSKNNFEIFTDYKPVKGSVSVDIVAMRGKIRKQKIFIMIASDGEGEIELSVNLLVSIFDSAERIVFINSQNPKPPSKKGAVSLIYRMEDLPT